MARWKTSTAFVVVGVAMVVAVALAVLLVVLNSRKRLEEARAKPLPREKEPSVLLERTLGPFPIDVVVLWVDGADASWRERARTAFPVAAEQWKDSGLVHSAMREPEPVEPGTKDELYYGARSVAKFMPWVRNYFILADRPHVPSWVHELGPEQKLGSVNVRVVHHDELPGINGPGGMSLPSYNSGQIQAQLWRIPGLAEHFVLFDDDMFIGQPMKPTHFFTAEGDPVASMFMVPSNHASRSKGVWQAISANNRALVGMLAGLALGARVPVPEHVPYPSRKSVWAHLATTTLDSQVQAMRQFRGNNDFAMHYVILGVLASEGRVRQLPNDVRAAFMWAGGLEAAIARLGGQLPHLFCINDRISAADRKLLEAMVQDVSASSSSGTVSEGWE